MSLIYARCVVLRFTVATPPLARNIGIAEVSFCERDPVTAHLGGVTVAHRLLTETTLRDVPHSLVNTTRYIIHCRYMCAVLCSSVKHSGLLLNVQCKL